MYGTFGAPQAVCERGVIILFLWNGFAIQMRLPVYTCHQIVINASQFTFRENNEAWFIYCCRLVRSSTHFGKRDWLDNDGEDSSLKKSLSLLFYSQSKSFVQALQTKTKFMKFTIVLWWYWKRREFFRYKRQFLQVSIFSFLGFAKFTIKTTTELVKFYSLNTENKEHHILRVKMLTKIIMAIFFSVYSVGGKSTYSKLIPICLFWGFSGHASAYVEKKKLMWKT